MRRALLLFKSDKLLCAGISLHLQQISRHDIVKLELWYRKKSINKNERRFIYDPRHLPIHCGHWDLIAKTFRLKTSTFKELIQKFANAIADFVYNELVEGLALQWNKDELRKKCKTFKLFLYALYATDVTFQQCDRSTGLMQDGKVHFSEKHNLSGRKVEVSVFPNGLALF